MDCLDGAVHCLVGTVYHLVCTVYYLVGVVYYLVGAPYCLDSIYCLVGAVYNLVGTVYYLVDTVHCLAGALYDLAGAPYCLVCSLYCSSVVLHLLLNKSLSICCTVVVIIAVIVFLPPPPSHPTQSVPLITVRPSAPVVTTWVLVSLPGPRTGGLVPPVPWSQVTSFVILGGVVNLPTGTALLPACQHVSLDIGVLEHGHPGVGVGGVVQPLLFLIILVTRPV